MTSSRRTDKVLERVRNQLRKDVERLGVRINEDELHVERQDDETLTLYSVRTDETRQTKVTRTWLRINDQGSLSSQSERDLSRIIKRYARRMLRLKAIVEAGFDPENPPYWSYTMHALPLAWMRTRGITATLAVESKDAKDPVIKWIAENADVALGDCIIQDGRIDVASMWDKAKLGVMYVGHGRPAFHIEMTMPDTVVAALAGRRLREAISHPPTKQAGNIHIVEAMADNGTTIILEDRQEFIRRPPKGIDLRWRRMDFDPWPN